MPHFSSAYAKINELQGITKRKDAFYGISYTHYFRGNALPVLSDLLELPVHRHSG